MHIQDIHQRFFSCFYSLLEIGMRENLSQAPVLGVDLHSAAKIPHFSTFGKASKGIFKVL